MRITSELQQAMDVARRGLLSAHHGLLLSVCFLGYLQEVHVFGPGSLKFPRMHDPFPEVRTETPGIAKEGCSRPSSKHLKLQGGTKWCNLQGALLEPPSGAISSGAITKYSEPHPPPDRTSEPAELVLPPTQHG